MPKRIAIQAHVVGRLRGLRPREAAFTAVGLYVSILVEVALPLPDLLPEPPLLAPLLLPPLPPPLPPLLEPLLPEALVGVPVPDIPTGPT
jgi:hypothetical protein